MRKFFTATFWDYAGERALKTVIQTLFVGGLLGAGLFDLDWGVIASLAGGTALASVATSILFYKGDGSDNPDDTSIGA
ncbi:holin [Microbacterium sp.]|uniref:holin n=1 Tax=Microbacterium sp. TaxID=51671 RepID=UPI0039E4C319